MTNPMTFAATSSRMRILELLMRCGPTSRKQLARLVGITSSSVTKITAALLEEGLIYAGEEAQSHSAGRKEVLLHIRPGAGFLLGLDVSAARADITLMDFGCSIVAEESMHYEQLDEAALERIFALTQEVMGDRPARGLVKGVGLLVPGYIAGEQSRSLPVPHLKRRTQSALGLPCTLRNNVRGLATVEQFLDTPPNNFILLRYGPGIASVIVCDGKTLEGDSNVAGELGHIGWPRRAAGAPPCEVCGKDACLQSACGFKAVIRAAGGAPSPAPGFAELKAACERDGGAALRAAMEDFAQAAAVMIQVIDPQLVLLAGEIFTDPQYFDAFKEMLVRCSGGGMAAVEISPVRDYETKRRRVAGVIALDAYLRGEG